MPALSVVVPAHARAARLRALLESLRAQDGVDVEIVVAADRPTAEVREVAHELATRVVSASGPGPAAARNAGWRAAAADAVAFVDDDCVAAPGWAAAMAARSAAAPGAVVQGRVEPHPGERDRLHAFSRTLWVRGPEAGPFFQTANILYPRAVLERLGGFDESYVMPAGEDTDLGWRAREAGIPAVFAPDALVWHAVHDMGPRALIADAERWRLAVGLVKRHPGIREHFHRRVFWKPSHERLLLALAGIALAGRTRGASLGLVAAWAQVHRREHPSLAALARALPAHAALDAAEVVALARGSAAARSLLL